ncbi:HAD family hydrolase [Aliigemmobacter aestuarii]|uniref:HAD family hydrolase n=1 Tax=Aliigemmobacter aestuarii TaxID=1445661 RepID=A0A4S3MMF0_9RHOB|nr:HAD-IA family hydrolase [Gemmobacter aestuarii]THD83407.1 HAD family hydrolase [Gemmobacter aestuarii]
MAPGALIFDVDGTLAETEDLHRAAFNQTFAAAGLPWHWSVEEYTRLLRTTGGKERLRAWAVEIGTEAGDDLIARLHAEKTRRYGDLLAGGGLNLRPHVAGLVASARAAGLRLAVATTTNRSNVDALTEAAWGIPADQVFDVIAAGDEVSAKKPAPDVYLLALSRLGLPARDALAFEDSRNGLLSARAAGLRVVVTPSIFTKHEDFTGAEVLAPDLAPQNLPRDLRTRLSAPHGA